MKKIGLNIEIEQNEIKILENDLKNLDSFYMDFGDMTDTFMTACILASIIPGKSKIYGI